MSTPAESPYVRRRVLVVDDHLDSARALGMLLGRRHDLRVAHTGLEAIEEARRFSPEVVFLDIGLPGMDGYEVARELRRIPEACGAKIIALTGHALDSDRERTSAAGFDMHFVKPFDPRALDRIIDEPRAEGAAGTAPAL